MVPLRSDRVPASGAYSREVRKHLESGSVKDRERGLDHRRRRASRRPGLAQRSSEVTAGNTGLWVSALVAAVRGYKLVCVAGEDAVRRQSGSRCHCRRRGDREPPGTRAAPDPPGELPETSRASSRRTRWMVSLRTSRQSAAGRCRCARRSTVPAIARGQPAGTRVGRSSLE